MSTGEKLSLIWGAPHKLECAAIVGGVTAVFHIEKPKGRQEISIQMPGVSLKEIEDAWKAQGQQWQEVYVQHGNPFVALRIIVLTGGRFICWYVYHEDDAPHDRCILITPYRPPA